MWRRLCESSSGRPAGRTGYRPCRACGGLPALPVTEPARTLPRARRIDSDSDRQARVFASPTPSRTRSFEPALCPWVCRSVGPTRTRALRASSEWCFRRGLGEVGRRRNFKLADAAGLPLTRYNPGPKAQGRTETQNLKSVDERMQGFLCLLYFLTIQVFESPLKPATIQSRWSNLATVGCYRTVTDSAPQVSPCLIHELGIVAISL